jgi:hypothetical protein
LFAAQKNVTRYRAIDPCQQAAVFRKEGHTDAALGAEFHGTGRDHHITEQGNGLQIVEGNGEPDNAVHFDLQGEVVAMEICSLRHHIEGILLNFHGFWGLG